MLNIFTAPPTMASFKINLESKPFTEYQVITDGLEVFHFMWWSEVQEVVFVSSVSDVPLSPVELIVHASGSDLIKGQYFVCTVQCAPEIAQSILHSVCSHGWNFSIAAFQWERFS